MTALSRRRFLALTAATGGAVVTSPSLLAASPLAATHSESFTFLFITDTHLQPELHGIAGCTAAFKKAHTLHADFVIQGGDLIYDALASTHTRSTDLYRIYNETEQQLGLKTYHAIGNHDLMGVYAVSGMQPGDADYGKGYFQQHIGPLHQSFNYKGVHFIVLDSVGITPERGYYGIVDDAQMTWLKADLAALPLAAPVIVVSHMPLVTAFSLVTAPYKGNGYNTLSVSNAYTILPLFEGHNVLGVLQGHTHVNERVEFNNVAYITSGAVCGDWWKGPRLGTAEGFTVCTISNGKLTTRYETYGFHADPIPKT